MLCIVYVSLATQQISAWDLVSLLEESRAKNARLDVTGILLYKDGGVMQLLEGPNEAVRKLIKTIYADSRHRAIRELLNREISSREFPDGSMNFRNASVLKGREVDAILNKHASESISNVDTLTPMRRLLSTFGRRCPDNPVALATLEGVLVNGIYKTGASGRPLDRKEARPALSRVRTPR